jgi:hypothetical protein
LALLGGLAMLIALLAGTDFTVAAAASMFFRFGYSLLPALFWTTTALSRRRSGRTPRCSRSRPASCSPSR